MIDGRSSSSSGWTRHARNHSCSPACFNDENARRHPTFQEFVKYAGLLSAASRGEESRQTILAKYEDAWAKAYPNDSVRLTSVILEGKQIIAPEDFSCFDGIPTSKPLPANAYIVDATPPPDSSAHGEAPAIPHSPVSFHPHFFHSHPHAYL